MPVYEYRCDGCGKEFEREQRISDDPLKTCPLCKSRRVKRLISRTSFVLKGGGWYSDLYSSQSGSSDSADASGAKSEETTTEAKPKKETKKKSTKKKSKKAAS